MKVGTKLVQVIGKLPDGRLLARVVKENPVLYHGGLDGRKPDFRNVQGRVLITPKKGEKSLTVSVKTAQQTFKFENCLAVNVHPVQPSPTKRNPIFSLVPKKGNLYVPTFEGTEAEAIAAAQGRANKNNSSYEVFETDPSKYRREGFHKKRVAFVHPTKRNPLTKNEVKKILLWNDSREKTAMSLRRSGNVKEGERYDGMRSGYADVIRAFAPEKNRLTAIREFERERRMKGNPFEVRHHHAKGFDLVADPDKRGTKTKRNPVGGETAARIAEDFHGDIRKATRVRVPRKLPGVGYGIGRLAAVVYEPPKGSRIGTNPRLHEFSDPKPMLVGFGHKAPWLIVGGRARFGERGFIG